MTDDLPPTSVPQGYLKLHLLSHRLVKPHGTDLTGVFGALKNVAWTSEGAIDIEELPDRQLAARMAGQPLTVNCVDKFPKMVDYVVPNGVRIADTSRVRLGAYVGEGTTVMHEGFINFNAGTEGPNMIEGRVSAGVFCGAGPMLAAALRLWAPSPAAAIWLSLWVKNACSAPMPVWVFLWAIAVLWNLGCISLRAPLSPCSTIKSRPLAR